jgi:hypothetical protein
LVKERFAREETMDQQAHFGDILDAVGTLSLDEQQTLVDIVSHRLAEEGRKQVVADVQESRREFAEGRCHPVGVNDIRDEILS